jgi:hypothetical protein
MAKLKKIGVLKKTIKDRNDKEELKSLLKEAKEYGKEIGAKKTDGPVPGTIKNNLVWKWTYYA